MTLAESELQQDEQDIVKATLYQAWVPLITQFPQLIGNLMAIFRPIQHPPIDYWGFVISFGLVIGPLVDMAVTFYAIRIYRRIVADFFKRFQCFSRDTTTVVAAIFIMHYAVNDDTLSIENADTLLAPYFE
jgi:hypothetical protein